MCVCLMVAGLLSTASTASDQCAFQRRIIAHICIGKQCACRAMKERGTSVRCSATVSPDSALCSFSLSFSFHFLVAISIPGAAATSAVHSRRLVFRHFLCALRTRRELLLLLSVPQVAVCVCVCVVSVWLPPATGAKPCVCSLHLAFLPFISLSFILSLSLIHLFA